MVQKQTNETLKPKQQQLCSPQALNSAHFILFFLRCKMCWVSLFRHRGHERSWNTNTARSATFNHWPHFKDTKNRNYFTFNKRFFLGGKQDLWIDKLTSCYPSVCEGREKKMKLFFGLMVSAHHCWTLGSLLLNVYFASSLPDLWITAHFFFFFPTQVFRCCAPRLTPDNSSRKVITVKHSQAAPFYSN